MYYMWYVNLLPRSPKKGCIISTGSAEASWMYDQITFRKLESLKLSSHINLPTLSLITHNTQTWIKKLFFLKSFLKKVPRREQMRTGKQWKTVFTSSKVYSYFSFWVLDLLFYEFNSCSKSHYSDWKTGCFQWIDLQCTFLVLHSGQFSLGGYSFHPAWRSFWKCWTFIMSLLAEWIHAELWKCWKRPYQVLLYCSI